MIFSTQLQILSSFTSCWKCHILVLTTWVVAFWFMWNAFAAHITVHLYICLFLILRKIFKFFLTSVYPLSYQCFWCLQQNFWPSVFSFKSIKIRRSTKWFFMNMTGMGMTCFLHQHWMWVFQKHIYIYTKAFAYVSGIKITDCLTMELLKTFKMLHINPLIKVWQGGFFRNMIHSFANLKSWLSRLQVSMFFSWYSAQTW